MANKISVILDVATDKAVSGLKGFKQSITDADGAVGKFKAGASGAFSQIKAHAGEFAMAAGAALVTFGVKAVAAFQDTALGAGKFADATGLSTETASRWVAVADDIGISAETMEKSFGKLAVSVGKNNPLLEEYGITVKKGADGQDDMNATMLHAVDVIKSIQDPTKKAAVAQAALGKGWMDMAELIQLGSGSLTSSMAEVSEAQVIDPEEVEKARRMRESLDNLQDSVRDVALVLGEDLVPMATAAADALATIVGPLQDVNQFAKAVATGILEMTGVIDDQKEAIDPLIFGYGVMVRAGEDYTEMARGVIDSTAESTAAIEEEIDATKDAAKGVIDYEKALEGLNRALDARIAATNALVGGDIAVRDSQRQAAEAVRELTEAEVEGKLTVDEFAAAQDRAAAELISAAEAATEYDSTLAAAAGNTLTATEKQNLFKAKLGEVASTLAPGSALRNQLQGYINDLNSVPRDITTRLSADTRGLGRNARGTANWRGGLTLVGEEGPELVDLPAGSAIHTAGQTAGMLNGTGGAGGAPVYVTVNAGMGADGKEIGDIIVGKIREYERRNGTGWRG